MKVNLQSVGGRRRKKITFFSFVYSGKLVIYWYLLYSNQIFLVLNKNVQPPHKILYPE